MMNEQLLLPEDVSLSLAHLPSKFGHVCSLGPTAKQCTCMTARYVVHFKSLSHHMETITYSNFTRLRLST